MTFVCFKWRKIRNAFALPAVISEYTYEHVNVLERMLKRHYHKPHRLICVTDDPAHINCETLPIWDKHIALGGCFNRLYTFSPDMKKLFGERFVCIDLDCVIVDDITPLFDRPEDFVMNSYKPMPFRHAPDQCYNGGLYMMDAGARSQVWDTFDPEKSIQAIRSHPELCIGSDQAWIRLCLGRGEARWTVNHGVYEARQFQDKLPENAKIVFFAGARDPSLRKYQWVLEHWR